ncbi:MAG: carbamoyltransferase HypF [Syntrophobacteraceae bacterium]
MQDRRVLVKVRGIVQGVGFRPYIYQLAFRHALNGWVRNQSDGVEIEIAGPNGAVAAFLRDLPDQAPPLARIHHIHATEVPYAPLETFHIVPSLKQETRATLISADMCTCADCMRELLDPTDRRYRYPFINCTNCGPRYTIVKDIPYDRAKTTMAAFTMCPSCRREYEDPMNRRFHAQPNACWECGPRVWLELPSGERLAERDEALRDAVSLLEQGKIVAIKGLGGFHLAVDAMNEVAVSRLRGRKIREEKPFAVMFPEIDSIRKHCEVSMPEAALLDSLERPIVILRLLENTPLKPIAASVAPRNRWLGAFLPYTPLHRLLFMDTSLEALVMTSGNQSDEPIVMSTEEARERLRSIADVFLFHDRDIYMRCDDSVARIQNGRPRLLRRARGYVPVPVALRDEAPSVLGVGGELKSTVCLTRKNEAFVSQHIGDLENLETLRSFEHTIEHLNQILEVEPECIVHDLHPDYLSTQWALRHTDIPLLGIQHHHAHIAAVAAEHQLEGPVLGLALDGTGYGSDGTVWGGEILWVNGLELRRLGHFRHFRLPGGSAAIKEPWRMAYSCLRDLSGGQPERDFPDLVEKWPEDKRMILAQMLARGINSPQTSSCGRAFDIMAALAGLPSSVRTSYEGQAAIELEQSIEPTDDTYEHALHEHGDVLILDSGPLYLQAINDLRRAVRPGIVAGRFHNGIVDLLAAAAERVRATVGVDRIALSGGVFQNRYLSERIELELARRGFDVLTHRELPTNDACIAFGQASLGAQWLLAGCP